MTTKAIKTQHLIACFVLCVVALALIWCISGTEHLSVVAFGYFLLWGLNLWTFRRRVLR